jgi:hypothetical protein
LQPEQRQPVCFDFAWFATTLASASITIVGRDKITSGLCIELSSDKLRWTTTVFLSNPEAIYSGLFIKV